MDEVPRAFTISDIQSSPVGDERYGSCVRSSMIYGSETRPLLVDVRLKFKREDMPMIRWMCGISMKDGRTNDELRRIVGFVPITIVIRSGRLRWYGHVIRKGDEDWVKKCLEFRVEGRRLVGRPRRTWLESVEADMEELEIDKEDVHDRKKWRENVMKRQSNPIGKWTINYNNKNKKICNNFKMEQRWYASFCGRKLKVWIKREKNIHSF